MRCIGPGVASVVLPIDYEFGLTTWKPNFDERCGIQVMNNLPLRRFG